MAHFSEVVNEKLGTQSLNRIEIVRPQPDQDCTAFNAKDAEDFNTEDGYESGLQEVDFKDQITHEIRLSEEQQNTPISITREVLGYNRISNADLISNTVVENQTLQGKERSS